MCCARELQPDCVYASCKGLTEDIKAESTQLCLLGELHISVPSKNGSLTSQTYQ